MHNLICNVFTIQHDPVHTLCIMYLFMKVAPWVVAAAPFQSYIFCHKFPVIWNFTKSHKTRKYIGSESFKLYFLYISFTQHHFLQTDPAARFLSLCQNNCRKKLNGLSSWCELRSGFNHIKLQHRTKLKSWTSSQTSNPVRKLKTSTQQRARRLYMHTLFTQSLPTSGWWRWCPLFCSFRQLQQHLGMCYQCIANFFNSSISTCIVSQDISATNEIMRKDKQKL